MTGIDEVIRRQDRVGGSHDPIKVAEDVVFEILILDDCFDDEIPIGERLAIGREGKQRECCFTGISLEVAPIDCPAE